MAKRPPNLIYALDELPPWPQLIALGLQHVFVTASGWVLIVLVVTASGGSPVDASDVIRMSMIASGVATMLQARTRGPVGSGYLCPFSVGPAYVSASIAAGNAGGLPLVFGMTAIAGAFEAVVSRGLRRLRALFPPEVTGVVVAMVGIELVGVAAPRFLGRAADTHFDPPALAVAVGTLVAMVVPTVWGKGKLRLYPVLVGLGVGYALAFAFGVLTLAGLSKAWSEPWVGVPLRAAAGWAFDAALLAPFLIAALTSTMKSVGDLTLCQKINDAEWKRSDMKSISGGILSGSISTVLAGTLGGLGQSTFSSNVGLSVATGATSRAIAIPFGIGVLALAFVPRFSSLFALMPAPVMGAILVYVACYMILGGLQVLTSRMIDARRTFVVGLSLFFGLSAEMVPGLYAGVPPLVKPLVATSLALTAMLAVVLNLVFRIGLAKRASLELGRGDDSERIFTFMERQGAAWGARPEVVKQAATAINECYEIAVGARLTDGPIAVTARFDEFNLDAEVSYAGKPMLFNALVPSKTEVVRDPSGAVRLAAVVIQRLATRVETREKDGHCRVLLHFEH